ncbi:putative calcium-binding protein CML41 [Bienertia sinuspersici]
MGLRLTLHKKKSKAKATTSSCNANNNASSSTSSGSPRSPFTPKGRTREEELKDVFRHFDLDNDGKISALELRRYFNSIGEILSQEEAQEVIDELDSDKDGMLEFQDFVKLMDNTKDEDLKKVFEMFEHEKGSGRITPRGLQRAFNRLGDSKSFKECKAMIQVYDADGDGELDFNEFHQMMVV